MNPDPEPEEPDDERTPQPDAPEPEPDSDRARHDWSHSSNQICITGKSGTGKSTYWFELISDAQESGAQLFIWDPQLEYAERCGLDYCNSWEACAQQVKRCQPVVFDFTALYPGDKEGAFEDFCQWVFDISGVLPGHKVLAIDEIQKYVPRSPGKIPESLQLILDEGRRRKLDLLIVSRRPNRINESIRAEMTKLISFQHTDKKALEWIAEDGFDPDQVRELAKPGGRIELDL